METTIQKPLMYFFARLSNSIRTTVQYALQFGYGNEEDSADSSEGGPVGYGTRAGRCGGLPRGLDL